MIVTKEITTWNELVEFHSEEGFFDDEQKEMAKPIVDKWVEEQFDTGDFITDSAEEYGEPGYQNDGKTILFGDWNKVTKYEGDLLEEFYELEWYDEWLVNYDGDGKAYRTSPDSYGWKPSYFMGEHGDVYVEEDMDRDTVIELFGINSDYDPTQIRAVPFDLDLAALGFTKVNDEQFESGFHPGQTDDPTVIIKTLFDGEQDEDSRENVYLFTYESSQFYTTFNLWVTQIEE